VIALLAEVYGLAWVPWWVWGLLVSAGVAVWVGRCVRAGAGPSQQEER
jgi:hypothetical protein